MNSDVGKTFIGTEKWLIKLFVMRKSKTTSSGRDEEKPLQKWWWRSSVMMIETASGKLGLSNIISSEKKMVLKSSQSASRKDNTPKEVSRNSILLN